MSSRRTYFGFEEVDEDHKAARVAGVFSSVARRYDLMNDLMSLGIHRLWKRFFVELCAVRPGAHVLDLAGGTGDITRLLQPRVNPPAGEPARPPSVAPAPNPGRIVLADINPDMLAVGRRRLVDENAAAGVDFVLADAQQLPFREGSFDRVCIAFGLRNVTRQDRALRAMFDVLRPGGKLLVLEFSTLRVEALLPVYRAYNKHVLPWLGQRVASDGESYRYLAESIEMHPDQDSLRAMMEQAGFERCQVYNLSAGVAAVHVGYRL
ncbi:MAG: class I SAM-dependent methyltransferase [Gammaproteobacteria bacterium]